MSKIDEDNVDTFRLIAGSFIGIEFLKTMDRRCITTDESLIVVFQLFTHLVAIKNDTSDLFKDRKPNPAMTSILINAVNSNIEFTEGFLSDVLET